MSKQPYRLGVATIVACLIAPVTLRAQLRDPLDRISPKSISDCQALGFEWMERIDYLIKESGKCHQDVRDNCKALAMGDIAFESRCTKEATNPEWYTRNPLDTALYTVCQSSVDRFKRAMRDAEIAKARCKAEVSDAEKRKQDDTLRKQKESDDTARNNAEKKSAPPSAKKDAEKRDSDRDADRGKTDVDKPEPKSSGERRPGDFRDDLRQMREDAIKAQQKADERALDLAGKASEIERAALQERTAERDMQKVEIEARQAGIDANYGMEVGQFVDRQAAAVARLAEPTLSADPSTGTVGGSSALDFDLSAVDQIAAVVKDVGKDALLNAPSMVVWAQKAYELRMDVDQLFSAMDRGPLVNWDRERARSLAKYWDVPEYIALANLPPSNRVVSPTVTPPEWLQKSADVIDVGQNAYDRASIISDTFSSLKQFTTGATPADRAQGFLDTMKLAPSFDFPSAIQAPLIAVNYAADALTGTLDEGLNQFSNGLQVFFTDGDVADVGDANAIGLSTFRNMPYLGGLIRGSERLDREWARLRNSFR